MEFTDEETFLGESRLRCFIEEMEQRKMKQEAEHDENGSIGMDNGSDEEVIEGTSDNDGNHDDTAESDKGAQSGSEGDNGIYDDEDWWMATTLKTLYLPILSS